MCAFFLPFPCLSFVVHLFCENMRRKSVQSVVMCTSLIAERAISKHRGKEPFNLISSHLSLSFSFLSSSTSAARIFTERMLQGVHHASTLVLTSASGSSSSAGGFGGRIPLARRMSFHSVSSFGSCILTVGVVGVVVVVAAAVCRGEMRQRTGVKW
jgi:hypothetical protein